MRIRFSLTDLATGETADGDNHFAVRMRELVRCAVKERPNAMGERATVMGRGNGRGLGSMLDDRKKSPSLLRAQEFLEPHADEGSSTFFQTTERGTK